MPDRTHCDHCGADLEGAEICPFCNEGVIKATPHGVERASPPHDPVSAPVHYTNIVVNGYDQDNNRVRFRVESLDIIEALNPPYHLGNVYKYLIRHALKGGLEDLRKAEQYLSRHIRNLSAAEAQSASRP